MNTTETYSMREFQPLSLMEKNLMVERKINDVEQSRSAITSRITQICGELSELNQKVRGHFIGEEEYEDICKKQSAIKKEKSSLEKDLVPVKATLRQLHLEKDSLKLDIKRIPDDKAKQTILSIRDKYMAFAADTTRVSSMRAMASKFAEELQFILKDMP